MSNSSTDNPSSFPKVSCGSTKSHSVVVLAQAKNGSNLSSATPARRHVTTRNGTWRPGAVTFAFSSIGRLPLHFLAHGFLLSVEVVQDFSLLLEQIRLLLGLRIWDVHLLDARQHHVDLLQKQALILGCVRAVAVDGHVRLVVWVCHHHLAKLLELFLLRVQLLLAR